MQRPYHHLLATSRLWLAAVARFLAPRSTRAQRMADAAQAAAHLGIWEHDFRRGRTTWTASLCRILELPQPVEDVAAERIFDFVDGSHAHELRDALAREVSQGRAHDMDLVLVTARNRRMWVRSTATLSLAADGSLLHRTVVVRDITLQKTAQLAQRTAWGLQRRTSGQLELALRGARLALWSFEVGTGRVTHAQGWETYGYDKVPANLDQWLSLVHPADLPGRLEGLQQCIGGSVQQDDAEYRMRNAAGGWVWVRSRGQLVAASHPAAKMQYAGVVMDISMERKARAERELLEDAIRTTQTRFERILIQELEQQQAHIARELHDSLGSELAGLSLTLGGAQRDCIHAPAQVEPVLAAASLQVRKAVDITRSLARGLMPVGEMPGGLVAALERLSLDYTKVMGVACRFSSHGSADEICMACGTQVFRIAQEAVTNAVRHGGATRLEIFLVGGRDRNRLTVVDNGSGIGPAGVPEDHAGVGVRSMRARARMIGGHLRLRSRRRRTLLTVSWKHD